MTRREELWRYPRPEEDVAERGSRLSRLKVAMAIELLYGDGADPKSRAMVDLAKSLHLPEPESKKSGRRPG